MDEFEYFGDDYWDGQTGSDDPTVGYSEDGTFDIPRTAQQTNRPWDSAGGSLGDYGQDVLGILKNGIGAWTNLQTQRNFIDYSRWEATNGGVYRQGNPAVDYNTFANGQMFTGNSQVRPAGASSNNWMMIALFGFAAILILKRV